MTEVQVLELAPRMDESFAKPHARAFSGRNADRIERHGIEMERYNLTWASSPSRIP